VKRWLVLCALWSIPGAIQAISLYSVYSIKGDHSLSLWVALAWRIPEWQVWALATPLILYAARRWPITRAPWKSVPIHFVVASVIAFVDVAVYFWLGRGFGQMPFTTAPFFEFVPIIC